MLNPADRYRAAVAAYGRGDFARARDEARALVAQQPRNAAALQLLGVSSSQAGDPAAGARYLRQAIAAGADTRDNRLNLTQSLLAAGNLAGARAELDIADPQDPDFGHLRAALLRAEGRPSEAVWAYEAMVHARPDDVAAWNNLGNARHALGDFDGAAAALLRARELDPKSADVHVNLARLYVSQDRYPDACLFLEQAALLAPDRAAPLLELGKLLVALGHYEPALRALGTAARLDPRNPATFVAIGNGFADAEDLSQAEQAFRVALQVRPGFAPALLNLGLQLEKANRLDELAALVADGERLSRGAPELAYLRALLAYRGGDLPGALALAVDARSPDLDEATVAAFCGQLADRLGDIRAAIDHVEAMNAAAAASPLAAGVDRSAYRRDIQRMDAALAAAPSPGRAPASAGVTPAAPVFLVGFPRSGTTLLDTFLMGLPGVHLLEEVPILETLASGEGAFDRLDALDDAGTAALRARYFTELAARAPVPTGRTLVIDKNPLAMTRIPLINRLFPDARIILALRHPADVVLSCWMQNFRPTEAMASFLDLDNAARTYDAIFGFWERCRALLPLSVTEVRYEDMVEDPAAALRPVVAALDLEWHDAMLDHQRTARDRGYIRTPSYAQVTEPVYDRARGRWSRYRDPLRPVLPILAPWCDRFGYSLD